jgi:hypothetical protein
MSWVRWLKDTGAKNAVSFSLTSFQGKFSSRHWKLNLSRNHHARAHQERELKNYDISQEQRSQVLQDEDFLREEWIINEVTGRIPLIEWIGSETQLDHLENVFCKLMDTNSTLFLQLSSETTSFCLCLIKIGVETPVMATYLNFAALCILQQFFPSTIKAFTR